MNNYIKSDTRHVLVFIVLVLCLGRTAVSQTVDIPDPNLHTVVKKALNLPVNKQITQADMLQLTGLWAEREGISDLSGLEHAINLEWLIVHGNQIADLTPLAGLTKLERIGIIANLIKDLFPLASLAKLHTIDAGGNLISDISPIANLTRLKRLTLHHNFITDVRPLSGLHNLERLEIQNNRIADHSPLDALRLTYFRYDQSCEVRPLLLAPRLENRTFPSVYASFFPNTPNQPHLSRTENVAQHDLLFSSLDAIFRQRFFFLENDWHVRGDMQLAEQMRNDYLALNPNMIFIAEVRMRDSGHFHQFPDESPYWLRDAQGNIVEDGLKDSEGRLVNFVHPAVQDIIVGQAIAVSKCGLYDGIFFDWWKDQQPVLDNYVDNEAEQRARDNILRRIRAATRPDFLIMGNTNDRIIPRTGPQINGGFMESAVPISRVGNSLEEGLMQVENSLIWLEQNLREPRINSLQGGSIPNEPPDSLTNLRWMRAITALSLTHSDGYVVFSIGSGNGHYWYDFWDADLGRPVGPKFQFYEDVEGLYIREFTNGWAVYNHSGGTQEITLPELATGVASGVEDITHTLPNYDGEMYLRAKPENPADVNGDGVVNILDLVVVAQAFGKDGLQGDVNGDGVVNVFDLVFVAGAIGGGGAAPSAYSPDLSIISAMDVERWLALAQGLGIGDANLQRGIRFLEGLLAALTPKETTLLPNYPNPFNPETWIPYRLARETEVTIAIYDTKGRLVRQLALGNQAAGYYAERGRAAYWDGRNERGEAVASGIYIYQFRAGDYAASRRMVIVK